MSPRIESEAIIIEPPGPLDYFEHPTTAEEIAALVPGAIPVDGSEDLLPMSLVDQALSELLGLENLVTRT